MTVYSLTEIIGNAGCYGVYSTKESAIEAAKHYIKDWEYDNIEETNWNGYHKKIYYGNEDAGGCFEICIHELNSW